MLLARHVNDTGLQLIANWLESIGEPFPDPNKLFFLSMFAEEAEEEMRNERPPVVTIVNDDGDVVESFTIPESGITETIIEISS